MMGASLWLDALRQAFGATMVFAEVLVAVMLFAHGQGRRPHAAAKLTAACVLVFACYCAIVGVGTQAVATGMDARALQNLAAQVEHPLLSLAGGLLICTLTLVAVFGLARTLYRLNGWAAMFCATTGYALQNLGSGFSETVAILADPGRTWIGPWMVFVTLGCCVVTDLVAWWFFIRRIDPRGLGGKLNASIILMLLVVAFGVIGFDLILKYSAVAQLPRDILLCLRAFHALVCVFVIVAEVELVVVRQLSSEKAVTERLLAEGDRQYRLSRANIEAINARMHDIRHDVLRTLYAADGTLDRKTAAAIVREVEIYDAPVHTGNEALDVVLTEKSFLCHSEGITLTCVADGRSLAFMSPADLYALLGELLDCAIDATRRANIEGSRSISLVIKRRANVASVHLESYGNPCTPAHESSQGLAANNAQAIVGRYGGTMIMDKKDRGVFSIDVMLAHSSIQ